MPFFTKRKKNQTSAIITRTEIFDVKRFIDTLMVMDDREIIGRFTQLFYHANKNGGVVTFKANDNQKEVSDYMVENGTKELLAYLVDKFDKIDELTKNKPGYSDTIKRELLSLVWGIREGHAYHSSPNDGNNFR
ncbi:MAG: hypothetical protein ACYC0J_00910 [Gammaproteobacteria bacterium]